MNPRAGYPAYSLSRGAPSASWVLLQVENKKTDWIVWRREWDSNPRKLALRWFSRPVPSTARPSLPVLFPASRPDAGYMLPQIAVLVNYLFRPAGKRPAGRRKNFLHFFIFPLAFSFHVCYYIKADIRVWRSLVSRLNGVSRGLEFESQHSDHRSILRDTPIFYFLILL